MGEYFYIVNLLKKQYVDPHHWNCGLKIGEFDKLYLLIINLIVSEWHLDPVAIIGDYDDSELFSEYKRVNVNDSDVNLFNYISNTRINNFEFKPIRDYKNILDRHDHVTIFSSQIKEYISGTCIEIGVILIRLLAYTKWKGQEFSFIYGSNVSKFKDYTSIDIRTEEEFENSRSVDY